ncbi:MAG TPA: RNA polymerase sigma-70 factor [Chitinophagaceae bacterium]|nr:RNA polymerase sigma-70 factor [Chitinophagaceae bacterium]
MAEAVTFGAGFRLYKVENTGTPAIEILQNVDEHTFEQVFKTYYKNLFVYAVTILQNQDTAEEIVQNVFFKLWEKKTPLPAGTQLKPYLYRAVHNESLNHIKHEKVKSRYKLYAVKREQDVAQPASGKVAAAELEKEIRDALNELPEQCRTVFQLSRFQQLKYRQIAEELGISVKTVENQMGKALKFLRLRLAEFLPLLILLNFLL